MSKELIEARGPLQQAFAPMVRAIEQTLGLQHRAYAELRGRLREITDKMPAAAIEALVSAGYQVVPAGAGKVGVQSQVTGSYTEAPFRQEISMTVRIGDFVFWRATQFQAPMKPPRDYALSDFAHGLAGEFEKQIEPLVMLALSELPADTFEEGRGR